MSERGQNANLLAGRAVWKTTYASVFSQIYFLRFFVFSSQIGSTSTYIELENPHNLQLFQTNFYLGQK